MTRILAVLLLAWPVSMCIFCTYSPAYADSLRAIDGDSLILNGERIRLLGIDTPEMACRCPSECVRAIAAQEALRRLLAASPSITVHRSGEDRYGRTLARVEVGGVDVGQAMVEAGHARVWTGRREPWC